MNPENIVSNVHIDSNGCFKYVLIRIHKEGSASEFIVRGYSWAAYHGKLL